MKSSIRLSRAFLALAVVAAVGAIAWAALEIGGAARRPTATGESPAEIAVQFSLADSTVKKTAGALKVAVTLSSPAPAAGCAFDPRDAANEYFCLKINDGGTGSMNAPRFIKTADGVSGNSKLVLGTAVAKAASSNSYWGQGFNRLMVDTVSGNVGVMRTITGDANAPGPGDRGWKDSTGTKYDRYVKPGPVKYRVTGMAPVTWVAE